MKKILILLILGSCTGMPLRDKELEKRRDGSFKEKTTEFQTCLSNTGKNSSEVVLHFKIFNHKNSKFSITRQKGERGYFYPFYALDSTSLEPYPDTKGERNLKLYLDGSQIKDDSLLSCFEGIIQKIDFRIIDPRPSWEEIKFRVK